MADRRGALRYSAPHLLPKDLDAAIRRCLLKMKYEYDRGLRGNLYQPPPEECWAEAEAVLYLLGYQSFDELREGVAED